MYIYEHKDWPNFTWNKEKLAELLVQVRYQQGRLTGSMGSIGFRAQEETVLETLIQDVIKSSEIEGEILDQSLVRSSVAIRLGMETAAIAKSDRNIEGVVEMMLDATQNFEKPLTKERLLKWHATLFPSGRSGYTKIRVGAWRTGPVQVISGPPGREKIHFEGPPAKRVEQEMKLFLDWLNNGPSIDPVLKSALAHLWFVTIHPFDDGNGRIARAIADLLLARSEKSSRRFYSLSAQIQAERKTYYAILESTQKGSLDVTPWIEWFFSCLGSAIKNALANLEVTLHKAQFWEALAETSLNERQKKIINRLLDGIDGKLYPARPKTRNLDCAKASGFDDRKRVNIRDMDPFTIVESRELSRWPKSKFLAARGITTSKWAKLAKCSQDTAYRDILDLVDRGILIKNPEGGRSTSYSLALYLK